MTNLEKYKEEIKEIACDNKKNASCIIKNMRNGTCDGEDCWRCELENLNWLCEEYQEPKIKLTRMEYDLLCSMYEKDTHHFGYFYFLTEVLSKGHFQGVEDTDMLVSDILANCEVVDDVKFDELEKENSELKKQLQAKDKALDKACEIISELEPAYQRHTYINDKSKTKDEWKEWCENEVD